jgi:hypothetical protein
MKRSRKRRTGWLIGAVNYSKKEREKESMLELESEICGV